MTHDAAGPSVASAGYAALLRDPRWQRKRLRIMERDGFSCVACGDESKTLSVHHLRYRGLPWDADDADLQTLCEPCHKALGKHSMGGVYYAWDEIGPDDWRVLAVFERCPVCGDSEDASHSGVIVFGCGHSVWWPSERPGMRVQWQQTFDGFPAFCLA